MKKYLSAVTGFSLIEVLVALLVFSLGLIGLAGLLVMSTQANHGAFVRTQATFLAQNMANRMHTNSIGLWQGDYDSASYPVSGTPPACSGASPCTPAQQAQRDQILWSDMLRQYLPNDGNLAASIQCTPALPAYASGIVLTTPAALRRQPPFSGSCAMQITWTERSLARGGSAAPQTFQWVFLP